MDKKKRRMHVKNYPPHTSSYYSKKRKHDYMIATYCFVFVMLVLFGVMKYAEEPTIEILESIYPEFEGIFLAPGVYPSTDNGLANLTIYDDTDNFGVERFTECNEYCSQKNKPFNVINQNFYSNYSDILGVPIDDLGGASCSVVYNLTGEGGSLSGTNPMVYDGIGTWESNNTFQYKGDHYFEVICSSAAHGGDLILVNDFTISNTVPYILKSASGFVDFDVDGNGDVLNCLEDSLCVYQFSNNVSEDDLNDFLTYSNIPENTTLTDFNLNITSGQLDISVTHDNFTGSKQIELSAQDDDLARDTSILQVNVQAVNDPPMFLNLANQSFNRSELFTYDIYVDDEEDNVPFGFNISFVNCTLASWSNRTDCNLFGPGDYTLDTSSYDLNGTIQTGGAIHIAFTPDRNDVGVYIINFSVNDSGNGSLPSSMSSQIVNFTVININEEPYFTYTCDSLVTTDEDSETVCYINVSDDDEENNLTFLADPSWFFNETSIVTGVTTGFNASLMVNFTPTDSEVGVWDVNVTVIDTGFPQLQNSTVISFQVNNVDDPVILYNLTETFDAFTSNNYTIFLNATDDDLLIPDASIYVEDLSFITGYPWMTIVGSNHIFGTNITQLELWFNPNDAGGSGLYLVEVNVSDQTSQTDSVLMPINITGNTAPFWISPIQTTFVLNEDVEFYVNLGDNSSDGDGDSLTYDSDVTDFASFNIDPNTGIINLTPSDIDVGQHIFNITISDGVTPVSLVFNFTVLNTNDNPLITYPPIMTNATTADNLSRIIVMEDSNVSLLFFVEDDDLRILPSQSDFYSESFNYTLLINGNNPSLFSLSQDLTFPKIGFENNTVYFTDFMPNKSDVGNYTVEFNITDLGGLEYSLLFNLTVEEIQHDPELDNLTDQGIVPNLTIYYDINSTDLEDGDDSSGLLIYSYVFLNGTDFILGNEGIFNTTSGVLNFTPTDSQVGTYRLNITVTDSSGRQDHDDFYITVYKKPEVIFPLEGFSFIMTEGVTQGWDFAVNASVSTNLEYEFYIGNNLRENFTAPGDGNLFTQDITPDYVDETYGGLVNVTLFATIPGFDNLNGSRTWTANIAHANAPVLFTQIIPDKEGGYGAPIILDLKDHFSDPDYFDPAYNQTVTIDIVSNVTGPNSSSQISVSVDSDWVARFNAGGIVSEVFNVTITDYDLVNPNISLTTNHSNYFKISFVDPILVPQPVPQPSSGGGGGGSGSSPNKPKVLKLLVPGTVELGDNNIVTIPLTVENNAGVIFYDVSLAASLLVDGVLYPDAVLVFDEFEFPTISPTNSKDVILTADLNGVPDGIFEIIIDGTVGDPFVEDSARILITRQERDSFTEKIIFTEDLIVENPECLELQELVNDAKVLFDAGAVTAAEAKIEEAVNACREAISQRSLFSRNRLKQTLEDKVFRSLLIATVLALALGIVYYSYRRIVFNRIMREQAVIEEQEEILLPQ